MCGRCSGHSGGSGTDLRIQNLFTYPDPIGAGVTNYTDNLTYTVVAQ